MESVLLSLSEILVQHPIFAPFVFVVVRAIPLIIPPIPGLPLDLVGVAVFGWKFGLSLALISAHVAATISFYIGRYFREPAVRRFAPLQTIHSLEDRYSEKQKFLALVTMRFVTALFCLIT